MFHLSLINQHKIPLSTQKSMSRTNCPLERIWFKFCGFKKLTNRFELINESGGSDEPPAHFWRLRIDERFIWHVRTNNVPIDELPADSIVILADDSDLVRQSRLDEKLLYALFDMVHKDLL